MTLTLTGVPSGGLRRDVKKLMDEETKLSCHMGEGIPRSRLRRIWRAVCSLAGEACAFPFTLCLVNGQKKDFTFQGFILTHFISTIT